METLLPGITAERAPTRSSWNGWRVRTAATLACCRRGGCCWRTTISALNRNERTGPDPDTFDVI
jgi:hypothetical protein